ncbi:membrane protein insertion efficiency factor YidD [Candidatus Woesebacteria bacterium]|nr:membrane protein insertion efficiency factor YidD [Candidatus Woesebacteria bacterium]
MFYSLYRRLSPLLKSIAHNLGISTGNCRYSPTCSLYAKQAITKHGLFYGIWLSIKRLLKCHPWSPGGFDPVP